MKVVLLGYMGSGKSSVGKILAQSLKIKFYDLDDYIESKEKLTISQLFSTKGEIYFRLKESEYLKELLDADESFVLALGGGTPCYSNNMDQIIENSISVYLKASLNTLTNRLIKEKDKRPLISELGKDKFNEFIAKHLFERLLFYEKATYSLSTDEKLIQNLVDEIKTLLV